MALDLYLIKKIIGSEVNYGLYHNRIKDANLEKTVESSNINPSEGGLEGALKNIEYKKPGLLKKFMDKIKQYTAKKIAKLQNNSFMALKAASLVSDVNINYASGMSGKEVRKCYKKSVRREIVKNSIGLGINLALIGLCYTPFTILLPSISVPFMLIGWQNFKNLGTILKGRKGVSFIANGQVSVLEEVIGGKEDAEELKNQDLMQYYNTHYGEQ